MDVTDNEDLLYVYKYDGKGNVIYKDIPDSESTSFYYDDRNLLIFTESPSLPQGADFFATIYDDYGRPIQTGFGVGPVSNDMVQPSGLSEIISSTVYELAELKWEKL
jgi:YD repeat-containing protein